MNTKPGAVRQGGVALVIAALLLVFSGVVAGPAVAQPEKEPDTTLDDHPSGKDRSVEPGNSGTQGKSESDPDDTANGGPDKPEGAGGFDSDKDGNNGCGNDDDFEDDNNGNCRGRVQAAATTTTTTTTQSVTTPTTPLTTETAPTASVLGVTLERPQPLAVAGTTAVRAGELAATGFSASALLMSALALIALGALLLMGGTRRRTV